MKSTFPSLRNFHWILLVSISVLLGGCQLDGYNFSLKSSGKFDEVQSKCGALYKNTAFGSIQGKMMIGPDELPTRKMITLIESPTDSEMVAIKRLEEANRTCRKFHLAAGMPTTASEDIYESRVSRLRFGLYNRDIPYGVYNLGVAQAMKEKVRFENESAVAFQKGKEIGRQRFKANLQQRATQIQLDSINSQLDSYNASTYQKSFWNCNVGLAVGGYSTVSCY